MDKSEHRSSFYVALVSEILNSTFCLLRLNLWSCRGGKGTSNPMWLFTHTLALPLSVTPCMLAGTHRWRSGRGRQANWSSGPWVTVEDKLQPDMEACHLHCMWITSIKTAEHIRQNEENEAWLFFSAFYMRLRVRRCLQTQTSFLFSRCLLLFPEGLFSDHSQKWVLVAYTFIRDAYYAEGKQPCMKKGKCSIIQLSDFCQSSVFRRFSVPTWGNIWPPIALSRRNACLSRLH